MKKIKTKRFTSTTIGIFLSKNNGKTYECIFNVKRSNDGLKSEFHTFKDMKDLKRYVNLAYSN